METSKIVEVNKLIDEYLDFKSISNVSEEDFKVIIIIIFKKLNSLKEHGLINNDFYREHIDRKYAELSENFENSPLYEERIQDIFSEIIGYCSPPIFWDTPFIEYMEKKWGIEV